MLIKFLLWVGFVRRKRDGRIRYPFDVPPRHHFTNRCAGLRSLWRMSPGIYIFRNTPGVIKWEEGRLLPKRWGIGICGFEFGDRGG